MTKFELKDIEQSWFFYTCVLIIFTGITLWPFVFNEYLGLSDYANHLARLHLLTGHAVDGWQKYYSIDHAIIPNLALDLVAGMLVDNGVSPETALRTFAALTNLLVVFGVVYVATCINNGRPPWLALWAFPLAFNRYFIWGFLNYFFAIGFGLFLFGLWISSRKDTKKRIRFSTEILISVTLIFLLLCHLMGYALILLCMGLYVLVQLIKVETTWKGRIAHATQAALMVIPSMLVYFFVCEHSSVEYPVVYQDILQSKISGIFSPFLSYRFSMIPVFLGGFLFSVLLVSTSRTRTLKENLLRSYPQGTGYIVIALLITFFVAPSAMMNSYFLDKRIFVVIVLVALSLIVYRINYTKIFVIVSLAFGCHFIRVVEINDLWAQQTQGMNEIKVALNQIKMGSKIESYNFTDDEFMPLPPLQHAVSMAIYRRAAFVPTIFAKPINTESIAMNPPYDKWGYSNGTYKYEFAHIHMRNVCKNADFYEYILVTYINEFPKLPQCMSLITSGSHFKLFKVNKP